ncbi:uncharacterized protein LW94_10005 [Fusarium fujikuroi]|nr:uncharacterized protein LW94_10005 [Fusarium fujikuroi]SCO58680.1 uncharacterized protein FFMR_15836 [Fusarium fujikuroi]
MAATDSARQSTAVDCPAPQSNAPFGYTARNIRTFPTIAYAPETMQTRLLRLSYTERTDLILDDDNGSPIQRLYTAAILDFAHAPQSVAQQLPRFH